ncbi:MAG: hypothetical protein V4736_05950 [Bdellovibrionota bacterium]
MKKIILPLILMGLSACGVPLSTVSTEAALESQKEALTCTAVAESKIWDSYVEGAAAKVQSTSEFRQAAVNDSELESNAQDALSELHELLTVRIPEEQRLTTDAQKIAYWASLEIGDQTTDAKAYYQQELKKIFARLQQSNLTVAAKAIRSTANCASATPSKEAAESWYGAFKNTSYSRAEAGGRWAFANIYQICGSLSQKPMDAGTADVKGISIVGVHPDGVGNKRVISDLPAFLKSHYYMSRKSSVAKGCFNTYKNPLIYDYGGKPSTDGGVLNFFTDAGDGTKVLGIDCSGFVFSAMATAGLKLSSSKTLKASNVHGISSHLYVNPASNGLDCLDKVKVGKAEEIKAGDIVAVPGHVFFVQKIGRDPMGIAAAVAARDCNAMSTDKFDFTVMQSNPSKGGIGVNIYKANVYVNESVKIKSGLLKYAKAACQNRLAGTTTKPNYSDIAITRHKGTPACLTARIPLESEKCIASCSDVTAQ